MRHRWITTRTVGRRLATLIVLTAMAAGSQAVAPHGPRVQAQSNNRPNVIFIVTDDQRKFMEGMPRTIQYFEKEGRRYPNAYATTPLCCPSRTSIFTGRYAHNHRVRSNRGLPAGLRFDEMLQSKLQDRGYRTGLFGKYLNGWRFSSAPPDFDDFALSRAAYNDAQWNINGVTGIVKGYNTQLLGDHAVDFIEKGTTDERPWMMVVTPYAPHAPFTPQPAYATVKPPALSPTPAMLETDRRDKPRWVREQTHTYAGDGRITRTKQYRTLRSVDDMVHRIMSALRRTGQENTIAVFISDNGFLWGEHGGHAKGYPYTESVKVPMYIRWPGVIRRGSMDGRMVANIDLAPTIMSVVGLPIDDRDGRDLLDRSWKRNRMHLEYWCNIEGCNRWASTRTKTYQYIEHYTADGRVRFREYYDLIHDRWQLRNYLHDGVAGNNPRLAPLKAQLRADRTCVNAACP